MLRHGKVRKGEVGSGKGANGSGAIIHILVRGGMVGQGAAR
jgi:hypothetical protein